MPPVDRGPSLSEPDPQGERPSMDLDGWHVDLLVTGEGRDSVLTIRYSRTDNLPVVRGGTSYTNNHKRGTTRFHHDDDRHDNGRHKVPR